jgi:hypothetical protein
VRKGTLRLVHLPWLLIFPLIYAVYSLIRGPGAAWYPYPFLDVSVEGMGTVLVNCVVMTVGFVLVGLFYLWLDRVLGGRRVQQPA